MNITRRQTQTATSGGIGLGGASLLVLLVLKVMGYIEMNWFLVLTSIFWVPVLSFLAVMAVMFAGFLLFAAVVGLLTWIVGDKG